MSGLLSSTLAGSPSSLHRVAYPLPSISLFSDERHAENWGRKEPWRGHRAVNTVELQKTTHIFRLSDLVERLPLSVSITSLRRQLSRAELQQKSKTAKYTDVDIGRISDLTDSRSRV
jgi:hypothetical protein